jgi:hypothetical protein
MVLVVLVTDQLIQVVEEEELPVEMLHIQLELEEKVLLY